MRLGLSSPLPPLETGIADYTAELLPFLARECELRLFVQEPAQVDHEIASRYETAPLGDLAHARAGGAVDLVAYEVGNSGFHAHQLRHVREHPGLLVLHDLCLHPLLAYLTSERGNREAYRRMLVEDYGEVAREWPERIYGGRWGGYDLHRVYYRLPLSGGLAKASLGVLVHSEHAARRIRRWASGPVRVVPHAASLPATDRAAARKALGIAADRFAVGMLGGYGPNRLPEQAVGGFARFARSSPDALLVVAGSPGPEIDPLLDRHGVRDRALFLGRPAWPRYLEALSALDAAIALRFPTCGETSGTGIRLMSVGVPFVTDGVDAFQELPGAACIKVPVQARVAEGVAAALTLWRRDLGARAAAGKAGLDAVEKHHRLEDAARRMVAFAQELLPRSKTWSLPPRERGPKVEAVVISYNGAKFIGPSLQSLLDQDYENLVVTVVDNASSDGTADLIRRDFPRIRLIASRQNLGFASGNNLVFRQSDADWIALLNQDAVARRDWISEMVRAGEGDPRIGAVGAKMLMQRCPTILNSAGIEVNEAGFGVDRWIGLKDDDQSPIAQDVFGVCGGAMMLRAKDLRELGGFDDSFFMYFEDVDLCWRMRLAGRRIVYAPLAVVHHDWHGDRGSGNRAMRRRYMCERNRLWAVVKNWEWKNLVRVWPQMKQYERMRLGWVRDALARGENVEYFAMVGRAIKKAWRSTRLRLPWLLWKRRKVQALRKVPDGEVVRYITPGVGEPSFVGDLEVVRDRFSATPVPKILMGRNDKDSLGPGWHPAEGELRWSKGKAWFYLRPEREARTLGIRVAGRPTRAEFTLWLDDVEVGSLRHEPGEVRTHEIALARPVPAGKAVEGRLVTTTFKPKEHGPSQDERDLGLYVFEIGLA
jgi:GT2 family glycosyltransferase/glycosyltransferase involved in cell wall biosynthesis